MMKSFNFKDDFLISASVSLKEKPANIVKQILYISFARCAEKKGRKNAVDATYSIVYTVCYIIGSETFLRALMFFCRLVGRSVIISSLISHAPFGALAH